MVYFTKQISWNTSWVYNTLCDFMQVLEDYEKRIQQSVAGFCFKYHMSGLCENLNSVCVKHHIYSSTY